MPLTAESAAQQIQVNYIQFKLGKDILKYHIYRIA